MPINATCSNCAKSYQAPDAMAGKSVRCKSCGAVFRIEAPGMGEPEPGDLDFDALERSFAGEAVDTVTGKPAIDSKGKVSIPRAANVADVALSGDVGAAVRSNFRYRFPMAKQIDQFLPWILLVGCLALLANWCLNHEAAGVVPEKPATGVGLSRFFLLLAAYTVLVFPAAHIAMHKASRKLRFAMPRAAAWRTFTGFMPLLLLAAGLYTVGGGTVGTLVFGILLGLVVSVGAVMLLYRLFPNEMPVVGGYVAGGAVIGCVFSIAVLVAVNLVALSVANMSKKEPTSFVSPIALGLRWQDPPAPQIATRKPANKPADPVPEVAPPATQETASTVNTMPTIEVPRDTSSDSPAMVKRIERPPVNPAFELILAPPLESGAISVLRDNEGGVIECYRAGEWQRISAGQGFERGQGAIAANTTGDVAMRMLRIPNYRLEGVKLGRAALPDPILFPNDNLRSLFGFIDQKTLLLFNHSGSKLALERIDISERKPPAPAIPFGRDSGESLDVSNSAASVRMTPDGRHMLVAGRAADEEGNPGRLAIYRTDNVARVVASRDLPLDGRFVFQPIGLAINNNCTVAMLLDTGNEAYFTTWQLLNEVVDGVSIIAPRRPVIDRKLGVLTTLRPGEWEGWYYDGLLWINDKTLLLFGTHLVDARTGNIIGTTGIGNIIGQVRESENTVLLIQRERNQFRTLLRVTFDPDAIETARRR